MSGPFSILYSLFTATLRGRARRGVTLIDTLVGVALMVIVFVGITGTFILSIDVVTNNKARIGALALANEQMEYLRSLPYDSLGTSGGIPSGAIPQTEDISLNNVEYTRTTLILYIDRPEDGLDGSDVNSIITDSKQAKVTVSWESRGEVRSLALVSDFSPIATESTVPGGTISISVVDADASPVVGASVRIVNTSTNPTIDVTSSSNASGQVVFLGAPASSGYEITVSKSGYSTAQTYSVSGSLPNPSPGHLTVSLNQTTQATFAIDTLGSYTIKTFREISDGAWSDSFANSNNISSTTNTLVSGGGVILDDLEAAAGTVISTSIQHQYLYRWGEFSWTEATSTGNTILYHVYAGGVEIPDIALPGNAAGFSTSPIDLSGLSTSTYPVLQLRADLSGDGENTPEVLSWQVSYEYGPEPLLNIDYALHGAKTIGTDSDGDAVYKYDETGSTGASGSITLASMEWDVYTLTVQATSNYDIAESCPSQPNTLSPGAALTTALYLAPNSAHTLLVDVRTEGGVAIPDASVRLTRTGVDETEISGACGQAFFRSLSAGTVTLGNPYTVTVTASGYSQYTANNVEVSGVSNLSVILTP